MKLKILGTGSKGNCYLLSTKRETLIIDCGINFREIQKGLGFQFDKVAGAIVSHTHKDHSLSADKCKLYGVRVFEPYKCQKLIQRLRLGDFTIQSFDLPHDGTPNRGFLIEAEGQKVLYMTDFEYCKYNFKSLEVNHMLIECNYQKEYVGADNPNLQHKVLGHCSLEYTLNFVQLNKTDKLMNVVLIHAGAGMNPVECRDAVKTIVGDYTNVCVADKGMEMELLDTPF